jgi:protein TonB
MSSFHPFGLSLPGFPAGALLFNDRLGVSVFGSVLVHMILIMGVSFGFPKWHDLKGLPTLEITLVQTQSSQSPKDAEFLANANQDGGGNSDRPDIARNPLPVREVSDTRQRFSFLQPAPQPRVDSRREVTDLQVQSQAEWQVKARDATPDRKEARSELPNLSLLERERREERARLNAEISRNWQEYQQRPRRKFLNARTQEYKYAAYMDAWRAKVERIGNLNYPEEAKRRHLTGSLVLDVALNADGSVNAIFVRRSSGHKLLDDAAVRIVEISAPFSPFTPEMRTETDVLHITRTWKFNESLTSEN